MRNHYRQAYSNMEGYYFPEHYMELPFWILTIAGMLPDRKYNKSLHIVTDLSQSIEAIGRMGEREFLLFSVMDANVEEVHAIAKRTEKQMILGGYTDPRDFSHYQNVRYLDQVENLSQVFEVQLGVSPDYSLFKGEKCIPRLTLSKGCLFRCLFCTVPTILTVSSPSSVKGQVDALKPLDFKLIYLDDKSFGQADNWRSIAQVREQVRSYNQDFQGFIVQTPPNLASRPEFIDELKDLGVKYIELGVETVSEDVLRMLNKPYRLKHLDEVCTKVRKLGLKIIPNFIMGIPGDNYEATVEWVQRNRDIIPAVNVNFLAVHYGSERGQLPVVSRNIRDRDQNTAEKSWLSSEEFTEMKNAVEQIYRIFLQ